MRRGMLITIALCLLWAQAALAQPTCTLNVSPASGIAPLSVTASGLCTSPDNSITQVFINWGDGTPITFVDPGFTVSHPFSSSGTFTVVLTAFDASGQGSASQTVHVSPPLQCSPQASPSSGKAPLAVTVTANCTDPRGTSNVVVQLGDGYYQGGPTVTHTYVSGGNFKALVTAKDTSGNGYVGSVSVNVTATPSLFVGINNGQVKQFGKDGSPMSTLNTNLGGSTTGMGFDAFSNLFVTDFTANAVSKFPGLGPAAGFGSGYNCKPESIVFDSAGNAYVGETGCSHAIVKLDPYGTITAVYQPVVEQQGTDWIDLSSDQCTLYYTSQGPSVLRFNVCDRKQMAPLTSQLTEALALRILPDGGVVVANLKNVKRLDGSGKTLQTYDAPGEDCWSSLALDSDGTSFWATDYCTSDVVRFDISSGAMVSKFNAGVPANSVFGVQTFAPPQTTAAGALVASPATASVTPGQAASYSLTFNPVGAAVGQDFSFSCGNLPAGASCTFSPATATAQASGVITTVTVNTGTGAAALLRDRTHQVLWFAILLPAFPLLLVLGRGRGWQLVLIFLALLLCVALVSCSGGGGASSQNSPPLINSTPPTPGNGATPSGTYTVLVHAISGSQQSSTTIQLSVQ
ncbi:MAG TPA: PKD domain-containing protein [Terriglobales bacterium]|nr:PKD domain-containing protein [Terriglobales bacterium]